MATVNHWFGMTFKQRSFANQFGQEAVVGDAEANKLLRRPYRAPWKYPA